MSLLCFLFLLWFYFTSSLFIYESNSQPRLIRPLPPLSLAPNQSLSLILNDYFQGFNLSFLFNDLQDPFISFSMNQALGFTSPRNFSPGFFQVIPLDNRKLAIFSATQQIYTVGLQQNQEEFTFSAIDFMNLDNDFLCFNMIALNSSKILLDCHRKSNQSTFLLTLFLDPTGKFLENTMGISETRPPFGNETQLNMKYFSCEKKIVYKNGILLRYCPENPLFPDPSAIFSVVEVFSEKSDGIFDFFVLLDQEKLSLQLMIVELAMFKVASSENFSFFLLDQVMGPSTVKYDNKTFKLYNDFPEILGDKKFLLRYKESESIIFVVSSHYISEIEINPFDYGKSLKKRQNFGKEYNNIIDIKCNQDYYFVQVQNLDFTTYLDIFSRTHINTDLLYKIAIFPSERYFYLENTIGPSSWLLFYDFVNRTYRFLTVSELSVDISCCKMPITNDMLPYNRTLAFSAFNYDEFSNSKSLISETFNITINRWATPLKDALGFRFYLMDPSKKFLEKEFFFQYEDMPPVSFNSQRLETCQNDYLSLGVQGDNDNLTSTINFAEDSVSNILGVGSIMDTKKKLPLLKVTEMKVSLDGNMDNAKSYQNPLVLGFFNFSFMKTEINSEMQIVQNFDIKKSFSTQAKLLYIDQEMFLQVTPDYSTLALNFTDNFLKDLHNNVTFFDLNKDNSLNLDGLFHGYVESYGFEFENYTNNNSDFVLETFIEKPGSFFSDYDIVLTETLDNVTNLLFSRGDFSILLKGDKIVLYGIPPLYNFSKIAELDLTKISPLFNYCSDFYLHDVQNIAVLICSMQREESKPKRLIFLGFNSSGFSDLIRETPIPQYIQSISKLIFLESFYFIVERLTDSLNESLIHIFSLEPTQLTSWSPTNNSSKKVTNMVILNYKRLNAESLNVDYLLIYDFQVKILGRLGDLLVIGVIMSDYFCLYYAEFTINFNKNPVPFVGTINKLSRLELNTLLGNYSHSLDLRNGFDWLETDEFGELKLLIFDEFDLMEISVSRFDLEPVVVRKYQSFYSCFHQGFTRVNTDFLVDVCEVSVEGYQENTESLLQVYVQKEQNLSIISQTLSFPKGSIINFDLQGHLLIIYLQNGTFLLYHLKQGVALKKTRQIQGNDIINGSFYARNRYSEARVFVRIIPGVFINDKVDVAFYLLIVVPIIFSFVGIFTVFAMIQWNKKKRKEIFLEKYFRGAKTIV